MSRLHYTILKKNTLLFRLVSNPTDDIQGPLTETGSRCLTPNYNVFFYPNPFVGKIILIGKSLASIDHVHVYRLKHDVKVLNLLSPSKLTRGHKLDHRNKTIKQCSRTHQGCLPFKGREFDPCFTPQFMKKHPNVLGMIAIAENDARGFQKRKEKVTDAMKPYIHMKSDSKGLLGVPEIILHPLQKRLDHDLITQEGDVLKTNYEVVDVLPIKDETLVTFMEKHAVYDPKTSFYIYKE